MIIVEQALNLFFGSWFGGWSYVIMPLAVFLISLYCLRRKHVIICVVSALLFSASARIFFLSTECAWVFRDGLGPDAVTSHGQIAVSRFAEELPALVTICMVICGLGFIIGGIERKQSQR